MAPAVGNGGRESLRLRANWPRRALRVRYVISAPIRIRIFSSGCARGNIERLGDAAPLLKVAETRPAGDAVVDDEEVATAGVRAHK